MTGRSILTQAFLRHFGSVPRQRFQSPLQLNLMGEICDLCQGLVLCCAEERQLGVALDRRSDSRVDILVCDSQGRPLPHLSPSQFHPAQQATDVLIAALRQRGYRLGGLRLLVLLPDGVPFTQQPDAVKIALAYALNQQLELGLSTKGLAKLAAQQPGHDDSGSRPGEQFAALISSTGHCALVDYGRLSWQRIPLPDELSLFRVDLGFSTDEFSALKRRKRQQTKQLIHYFSVGALRELSMERLNRARGLLSEDLFGCARHLLSEHQRALSLADALVEKRLDEIGPLLASAHLSLKREFGFESRHANLLVSHVNRLVGNRGGARLLSSGEVIALIPKERKTAIVEQVTQQYTQRFGVYATFFNINAASGAHSVR
ncbi:galactokinase [Ferrimonas sediminicola]|uniref:hypothetical protein n=1 Tax=Ferrimonas sediminicola TaxID=2569538 RepID=UPI00145D4BA0|nr:hypothetical protein [Ferrimonas sediminicola]